MTTATFPAATAAPPSAESVALERLIQRHRREYDFYVERAKADGVRDADELPAFPRKIVEFSVLECIAAALDKAVYEPEDDAILVTVRGAPDIYTCGYSQGEAVAYLIDLVENEIVLRLQEGNRAPPIPGVESSEFEIGGQSQDDDDDYWDSPQTERDAESWREEPPVTHIKKIAEQLGILAERRGGAL